MSDAEYKIKVVVDSSAAQDQVDRYKATFDDLARKMGVGSAANDNHTQSVRRLSQAMMGTADSGSLLSRNFGTLEKSGAALAGRLGSLNGALGGLAFAGASAGALALVGAFTAAGTAASRYQDVMAKISTNVDTATFDMKALSDGILKQSAAFGGMPVEEASAAYDIISAGASSAAEALDILKASNGLAVGGMTSIGVAADGLTSILNSYAGANLSAAQASDAMFIAARDGKTTIDQIASSVGNVAPIAAAVGVSFDGLSGALGVLTKGGIKTAESVTGLKAIMSAYMKPSDEAKKAAKSIGLEFDVAALRAKGLRGALQDMAEKTGYSSSKITTLLGSTEATNAVLSLTKNKGAEFAATMDHMASKAGATAEAVKKMQDGSPSFQWDRVVASATAELIKLGQSIATVALPTLRALADNMGTIFAVGKAAAAGLLAFGAASAAMKLGSAVGEVIALQRALGATGVFSALFGAGMKIAQSAVNGLTVAMAANPIGLIAVALTTTIALLYQFRDAIMISSDGVTSLGDFFRAVFESVGPALTSAKNAITGALSGIWEGIKSVFGGVGSFLYSSFSVPLDAISGLFSSTFGDLPLTFEGVLTGAARVADLLVGVFAGSFNALVALWNGLPAALGPNFQAILSGAKNLVVGIGSGIASVWNAIVSFGSSAASTMASVFNSIGSFIERWANKAITAVNSVIAGANKLGAGLAPLATVHIGQIAPPKAPTAGFAKLGQDMGSAFNNSFGHTFENGVKGLMGRAKAIGAARGGAGASTGGGAHTAVPGAVDDSGFADPAKKSDAQKAAERRAKAEADFWQTLKNEVDTAALFGIEQQKVTKEKELQKVLGRAITDDEKTRVDTAVQDIANNKAITGLKQQAANLANENNLLAGQALGLTDKQKAIEDELFKSRLADLNAGANINSADYKQAEEIVRKRLEENQALKERSTLLTDGLNIAKKYSAALGAQFEVVDVEKERTKFLEAFNSAQLKDALGNVISEATRDGVLAGIDHAAALARLKPLQTVADYTGEGSTASQLFGTQKENADYTYQKSVLAGLDIPTDTRDRIAKEIEDAHTTALTKVANAVTDKFVDTFSKGIDELGDLFGGTLGKLLKGFGDTMQKMADIGNPEGSLAKFFTQLDKNMGDGFKTAAKGMELSPENLQKGFDSLGTPLKSLTDAFSGPNGSFMKGIGAAVGGAMQGAELGKSIGQLMSAVGIKHGETGAQIGGAIGGITGNPFIAAGASVLGGILGSLLYKPPWATASLTGTDPAVVSGSKSSLKTAASGAAGSVQDGLSQIAEQLGGAVGAFSVAIGQWDGKWRVNDDATNDKLHFNNFSASTLHDFGTDGEQAAVEYAIKNAIADGAITGLEPLIAKGLQVLSVDAAIQFGKDWTAAMADYKTLTDPMGAAVDAVLKPLLTLKNTMMEVGASAEDMAKFEDYRAKKLDEVLKDQTSSFRDILDQLNGSAGGVTPLAQLTSELASLDQFKGDIAAGKTVDQGDFSKLVDQIMGNAGNVYGASTSQYQDIVKLIRDATTGALANATTAFNNDVTALDTKNTTDAVNTSTAQITATIGISNDYLAQIAANTSGYGGGGGGGSVYSRGSVNGSLLHAY